MSCVRHNDSNVTCNAKAKGEVSSVSLLPKLCNLNQNWRNTRTNILSEPTFSTTLFTTKCTKSDGPAGPCARASFSNLAKSCRNSLDLVKNK